MKKQKHAIGLLQKARDDLRALQAMLDAKTFTDEIFGFHAQQAIEKALKAWIDSLGLEYPITHDISVLLRILSQSGIVIREHKFLISFNSYAILFRYVTSEGKMPAIGRRKAIDGITKLLERIAKAME